MSSFAEFFQSDDPRRDAFLSRLFGIFSEDVVREWCAWPAAPYEDLGRPTLRGPEIARWYTLDFALRERANGRVFVAEMKCELAYDSYKSLRLVSEHQLVRHVRDSRAFAHFIEMARDSKRHQATVSAKPIQVEGAILIWGAVSEVGRLAACREFGLHDVLSVETMLSDLQRWQPETWKQRLAGWTSWSSELFAFLDGA